VHVPFKGGAPSTADSGVGRIDRFRQHDRRAAANRGRNGRGLAVTSLERSPYFPDLPSVHEAVVPTFIVETWNGIMTASKTPEPVIRKLSEILIKMADDPEVKEVMRRAGANTVKTTPEQYRAQIHQEIAQWKPLIAEIADKEKK
jgi:tripartite-type tricarboxylate transporter receptor subunit TctC